MGRWICGRRGCGIAEFGGGKKEAGKNGEEFGMDLAAGEEPNMDLAGVRRWTEEGASSGGGVAFGDNHHRPSPNILQTHGIPNDAHV